MGLQDWVDLSKRGGKKQCFPRAGRAAPRDFPRANPKEIHKEQPCQPKENPILTNYFT